MDETSNQAPLFPDLMQRPMSLDWASDDLVRYTLGPLVPCPQSPFIIMRFDSPECHAP